MRYAAVLALALVFAVQAPAARAPTTSERAALTRLTALAAPTPAVERARIVAEFGSTYLPRFMPAGYIYIRWTATLGSADAYGEWLQVLFGDHGRRVQWTVENTQDPQSQSHEDCTTHVHFAPSGKVFHRAGKTLYYIGGVVGQDVTVCLPGHHGLVVWNGYSLSAQTLVTIAASAQLVR